MKCEGKKTEVRSRVLENLSKAFQPKHSMVITKFYRMDSLPNVLTHGAPLARFARESSAIM